MEREKYYSEAPKKVHTILANFGGPRSLEEISPFLQTLLTDQDVVRTNYPPMIHRFLFKRIAKRRAQKISGDYTSIGGKSPIFEDTVALATHLEKALDSPVTPFHRYLPATHDDFIATIEKASCDEIRIFPMFPQFTYATTGSIARWFDNHFSKRIVNKMRWVKSYPTHPQFILAHQEMIAQFLTANKLEQEETVLLFSAHGIPEKFQTCGDIYKDECLASFNAVMQAFPKAMGRLSFQSKFGPGEWLRPYTINVCEEWLNWSEKRKQAVFVPISFTSDHIETLFEIETEYMPVIREQGGKAYRVSALTMNETWIKAIPEILRTETLCNNAMLIRPSCPRRCNCM